MADEIEETSDSQIESAVLTGKSEVIEILYDRLTVSEDRPSKERLIVDSDMLVEAIKVRNDRRKGTRKPLSTKNPANFLKDFIRTYKCNSNWPARLTAERVTARQVYGSAQIFEFVAFGEGQIEPFPNPFDPAPNLKIVPFQSLTIPMEARKLGRPDEAWLVQVAVSQRLIESHLAIFAADSGLQVSTLAHLQVSVKTQPEIDATFVAVISLPDGMTYRAFVTIEAKQIRERILEDQIREQVKAGFSTTRNLRDKDSIDAILPMVIKVVDKVDIVAPDKRCIYIAQFKPVFRSDFVKDYINRVHEIPLEIQSSALYEPFPSISGISSK